jgi:hypothetical protein
METRSNELLSETALVAAMRLPAKVDSNRKSLCSIVRSARLVLKKSLDIFMADFRCSKNGQFFMSVFRLGPSYNFWIQSYDQELQRHE